MGSCRIKPQQRGSQCRHRLVAHPHWPREDAQTQLHPEKCNEPEASLNGARVPQFCPHRILPCNSTATALCEALKNPFQRDSTKNGLLFASAPLLALPNLPGWVINGPIFSCSMDSRKMAQEKGAEGEDREERPLAYKTQASCILHDHPHRGERPDGERWLVEE